MNGKCWLCNQEAALTLEHIPARRSFNTSGHTLRLQQVSKRSTKDGVLIWEDGERYTDGFARLSLCLSCNQRSGRSFVSPYGALTDAVAKLGQRVPCGFRFLVPKVKSPNLVLRQVLHQFVTANGIKFVEANPWIRTFLMDRTIRSLPADVFVYVFAMKEKKMRITGIGGTVFFDLQRIVVLSEFSFWPLGTVLSFHRLNDVHLTDITEWADAGKKDSRDLTLSMCHAIAPAFVDFRSPADVMLAPFIKKSLVELPLKLIREMRVECQRRSGRKGEDHDFIYPVHPSLLEAPKT